MSRVFFAPLLVVTVTLLCISLTFALRLAKNIPVVVSNRWLEGSSVANKRVSASRLLSAVTSSGPVTSSSSSLSRRDILAQRLAESLHNAQQTQSTVSGSNEEGQIFARDMRLGVLFLNLGGPERVEDVEGFLYNLFADPDIIRLPALLSPLQRPLAYFIAKRRAVKSSEAYRSIGGGSPIVKYTREQAELVRQELQRRGYGDNVQCYVAMRYWHPYTEEALAQLAQDNINTLVVLPMYPQFSISTSGSSLRLLQDLFEKDETGRWLPASSLSPSQLLSSPVTLNNNYFNKGSEVASSYARSRSLSGLVSSKTINDDVAAGTVKSNNNSINNERVVHTVVPAWYQRKGYLRTMARLLLNEISQFEDNLYTMDYNGVHVLFSAHGVPQSYIAAGDPYQKQVQECVSLIAQEARHMLRHLHDDIQLNEIEDQSVEEKEMMQSIRTHLSKDTALRLAGSESLSSFSFTTDTESDTDIRSSANSDIRPVQFHLSFQSRVGPIQWLRPYTEDKLIELGRDKQVKSLVVVPVSFVSEHIETLEEIDMEYRQLAEEQGVQNWRRVPALNTDTGFIRELASMVEEALAAPVVTAAEAATRVYATSSLSSAATITSSSSSSSTDSGNNNQPSNSKNNNSSNNTSSNVLLGGLLTLLGDTLYHPMLHFLGLQPPSS